MAALVEMAAPGVADARVPCPLCGGLIHPVAGRCKHCKQDLAAHRAGKPAAVSPLPALIAAAAVAHEQERPVLPPRPTGTRLAAQPEPKGSLLRNWPVLVIVLAATAIVGALVIMVWPEHHGEASHTLKPPPAPERMDTDPSPSTGVDPWKQGNAAPVPRSTPDPLPPQPPAQPDDDQFGFGGLANGLAGGGTITGAAPDFMFAAMGHACKKLATCPNADDTLKSICDVYSSFPAQPAPTNCAEAKKCLDAIDNMSCSQQAYGSPLSVVNMFQDCTKAITSC